MNSKECFGLAVCCVLALPLPSRAAGAAAFQLGDLQKIVSLSDVKISPDGKQIAMVVSTPDWKSDKAQLEIDIVDAASGARRAVTWKRAGISSPKWSQDGTRLAFLAEDSAPKDGAVKETEEKQVQIFIMPMNGGDPVRVTDAMHGVDEFAWSPDGKQIAFITADEAVNAKAIKEHDDAFQVTDNNFLIRAALTPWHLWVIPSSGGAAKRLTQGTFSLQTDQQNSAPVPEWSHDGRSIVFTRFSGPYWGPSYHSVIAAVDASGGETRTLVSAEGSSAASYAPGSDALAFERPRGGDQNNGIAVYVMANGASRDVSQALARNFNAYAWLPGGKALLLEGDDGTRSALWEQPSQGTAKKLDLGEVEATPDLSVSKTGAVAFVGITAAHPGELYVMNSVSAKPRRLTNLNAFVDGVALGRTESIEWQGPNGFLEDGALTYPVGYQRGQRYPLVLLIHGGPESSSQIIAAAPTSATPTSMQSFATPERVRTMT